MKTTLTLPKSPKVQFVGVRRRFQEFSLIFRDPVLFMSLLFSGIFIFVFVILPILRTVSGGFISEEGTLDLSYFARYFDDFYGPGLRRAFLDTMIMGLMTATFGTLVGFIFAYASVRCNPPGKNLLHWLALLPTVSPPFALALSVILLFGRNGLITKKVFGINFVPGMNDIYGLDGLVLVQTITFFSVAYLILRAMLERLNPSMEEAAASLRANRLHIFRTVTLPLLIPGIAGSFLLLFVESLADLGNPLFIAGNRTVLSAQIFLAVIGEYDYQKASALSLILIIPTLLLFLAQRYYVNRRSYISVTGKPSSAQITEKDPLIRWGFNGAAYLICAFVVMLYVTIIYGSFSFTWGVDYTPTLRHWSMVVTRGVEAILDTTFLSALATPFAAFLGMVIAWLVVRKNFSGKEALDFASNLGGAVPGTILGIGFVLVFNRPPLALAVVVYALLALFFALVLGRDARERLVILLVGTAAGVLLTRLEAITVHYVLGGLYLLLGLVLFLSTKKIFGALSSGLLGIYVMSTNWANAIAQPIADFSRSIERGFWSNAIFQFADHFKVLFQPPPSLLAIFLIFAGILLVQGLKHPFQRMVGGILALTIPCAMSFMEIPFALVGGAYIIMAAFVIRSLPASVRAGVASLQQIDPSIEEASNILGADTQYTFRKVTLPLILPALLAGLIFSFTRHMTSLSAIVFLVSAKWRIVTASILSEWEQGGVSIAAAYSTLIILFVMIAIVLLNIVTTRLFRGREGVDLSQGL
ncbi:MAG TPA: iron ABC transporter permease [Anaerolineales bacterium]|nr:iron ABC transporter permease [Anaerolineales bacterium]